MQKKIKEMTEQNVLQKLRAICSRSEHCSYEMQEKMTRWGVDEQTQARIISALVKGKYIDDKRFARAFANDKVRYNKWGKRKVEQALYLKHIDEDIRHSVLNDIEEDDFKTALQPLLQTKIKSIKAKSDYELNCKLIRFALGRGYELEEIKECLTSIFKEDKEKTTK